MEGVYTNLLQIIDLSCFNYAELRDLRDSIEEVIAAIEGIIIIGKINIPK